MSLIWYRTGTINLTQGNDLVVGVGTYWQSAANKPAVGDMFKDGDDYEIVAINSDGSLQLDRPYEGVTVVGSAYAIVKLLSQNATTRLVGEVSGVLAKLGDRVTVSTSAPAVGQGQDGDIWIVAVG
jgi:hypothetical protein